MTTKKLFLGTEIHTPWPTSYPKGRLLEATDRHLTLAFLGNVSWEPLLDILKGIPTPLFRVGMTGDFDNCLFLPMHRPNVVSWHVHFHEVKSSIFEYQNILSDWLLSCGYPIDSRDWLPHVTVCRAPFSLNDWKNHFSPLPLYIKAIHLYESLGNLNYHSLWSFNLIKPFEEIAHTADMAFSIHGENLNQIFYHALTALAFEYPNFVNFFKEPPSIHFHTIEDIIIQLNERLSIADQEIGCPWKAISFHGQIEQVDNYLKWEMIVDV